MNAPFTLRTRSDRGFRRPEIVVWLVEFADWRQQLSTLRQCLDASQLGRAARLRDPMQRRDRELVHALHRTVLGDFLGLPAASVPLRRSANGRPWLQGHEVSTSLSHSIATAAIAISTAGPVGVDIEPRSRNFPMAELADRICHPDELPCDEAGLLRLWVRKEAALKAIGTGLSMEMSSFCAPDRALVSLRPDPASPCMTLWISHVDAGAGCVAAVAGSPDADVVCRWLLPGGESSSVATGTHGTLEHLRNQARA